MLRRTYAGYYGQTIAFFLRIHKLTGEVEHRVFAHEVAREAVAKLYHQGIFRGHPAKPYYESLDGVGDLLCAFLELDAPYHPPRPTI